MRQVDQPNTAAHEARKSPLDERPSPKARGEGELLARHVAGDASAFAELVSRYRAPVYSYLCRCGIDAGDRDDLLQEIFLRVHRSARSYDNSRPLHPWVFTIVANAVRNHLRRRRVHHLLFERGVSTREPADPSPDGESRAQTRQAASWLEGEMRRLPLAQREVLLLTCVEGLALKLVAESLQCPLNTVKTRLHRARMTLLKARARQRSTLPVAADVALPD